MGRQRSAELPGQRAFERPGFAVALAAVLVGAAFLLQHAVIGNAADEGFLWYGVWRTALGEVPIRDFQSYDPGRYYWGAAWAPLFGDGLLGVRASLALLRGIGLALGLLVLRRLDPRPPFLLAAGLLLFVWMHPSHKAVDIALGLGAVFFTVRLLEAPTPARHLAAGIFVGIAACFGRNHGLYALLATGLCVAALGVTGPGWDAGRAAPSRRAIAWSGGILLGFAPVLAMHLLVPGFFESYVQLLAGDLRSTNVQRSIPWPWQVWHAPPFDLRAVGFGGGAAALVGSFYVLWLVFLAGAALVLLRSRGRLDGARVVLLGAALVSLPYLHHASDRAGLGHLAQSIHPLLVGLLAVPFVVAPRRSTAVAAVLIALLGTASALTIGRVSELALRFEPSRVWRTLGDDRFLMRRDQAALLDAVRQASGELRPGEALFAAPNLPWLYAALARPSPSRTLYFTLPETEARQRAVIRELEAENVTRVVLDDRALDGRDELRFRSTHPVLWAWLSEHFEPAQAPELARRHRLLRRSSEPPR